MVYSLLWPKIAQWCACREKSLADFIPSQIELCKHTHIKVLLMRLDMNLWIKKFPSPTPPCSPSEVPPHLLQGGPERGHRQRRRQRSQRQWERGRGEGFFCVSLETCASEFANGGACVTRCILQLFCVYVHLQHSNWPTVTPHVPKREVLTAPFFVLLFQPGGIVGFSLNFAQTAC